MMKIMKEQSSFSFIEERDWFIGDLKLREVVIEEKGSVHYNNGLITEHVYKYYIRVNERREICSGQVSRNGIIREISINRCIDVINAVDWNNY